MKTGLIDVGGGMRGIYCAGILDRCLDRGIHFDGCVGVSAGCANIASFMAGQRGRNYRFYTEFAFRKEYMSWEQYFKTGSYINLPYIYGGLTNTGGEYPIDYDTLMADPAPFCVVAANAETGQARYFQKADMPRDHYDVFMASSCVPGVDKPIVIDGVPYFDGALGDPVPLQWMLGEGYDRIVLLLTKPLDFIRTQGKDRLAARLIHRKYPCAAEGLLRRAGRYNEAVAQARQLAAEGKVLILAPEDITGVDTLKKDHAALDRLYRDGYKDGEAIEKWMK